MCSSSRKSGAIMARSEESLIFRRADIERALGFGADEGSAGIVEGRAGGDELAGTRRGVESGCSRGGGGIGGEILILDVNVSFGFDGGGRIV